MEDISSVLGLKTRVLSLGQIANTWFSNQNFPKKYAYKCLKEQDKIFQIDTAKTYVGLNLQKPVLEWKQGDNKPNFDKVAYKLQSRWKGLKLEELTVVLATAKLFRLYGFGFSRLNFAHVSHDLFLADMYLLARKGDKKRAEAWTSENQYKKLRRGEKVSDVFLIDKNDKITKAIDFGGKYPASRVRKFHQECVKMNIPYELW